LPLLRSSLATQTMVITTAIVSIIFCIIVFPVALFLIVAYKFKTKMTELKKSYISKLEAVYSKFSRGLTEELRSRDLKVKLSWMRATSVSRESRPDCCEGKQSSN